MKGGSPDVPAIKPRSKLGLAFTRLMKDALIIRRHFKGFIIESGHAKK